MSTSRRTLVRVVSLIALSTFFGTGFPTLWAGPNLWTSIGPDGGLPHALAIAPQSPRTIYAATGGGIFKSTDGGSNWKALSMPRTAEAFVSSLAIDPINQGTVYAGTYSGVFKTTDGGTTWSRPQMTFSVSRLAIDPRNPGTLFAASSVGASDTILKTADGGRTWSPVNAGLELPSRIFGLVIDPQNPSTIYAGTTNGLFKSTDGGTNWSLTANPYRVIALAIDPQHSSTLYASDTVRGVFKSIDGGATWTAARSGLPQDFAYHLQIDPQNDGTVYAGTINGVFKTTDAGKTWTRANFELAATVVITLAIDPQNPATVYVVVMESHGLSGTGDNGLFKSTNGGANWTQMNSGLSATSVRAIAIDREDPYTIYAAVDAGLFKKTDGGTNWASAGFSDNYVSSLVIQPQAASIIYATSARGVFKSTDRGASWNPMNSGLSGLPAYTAAIDPQDVNTLYVGTYGGVFKSTDGGENWSAAGSLQGKSSFAIVSLVIDPQRPSTIYAVIYDEWDDDPDHDSGAYKTTDGGASWVAVNDGLPIDRWGYAHVHALMIDPKNSNTLYAGTFQGVFKSTNGGASWSAANSGLTGSVSALTIDPLNPSMIYAGIWDRGVFKSTDAGSTWNAVNSGLTTLSVQSLVIDPKDPNRLYAGTIGGGAFAITFVPDSVVTELRFDRTSVMAGGSFSVNISGPNLTTQTFFDVRFASPESNVSDVTLNWQRGVAATHSVPAGIAVGIWTITGVRAHEIETDHTASFVPVSANLTITP